MATTVTPAATAAFQLGPFDTLTLSSGGARGSIVLTSFAPKLCADQTLTPQNGTFGPWGAPMSVVMTITQGSCDYTVNQNSLTPAQSASVSGGGDLRAFAPTAGDMTNARRVPGSKQVVLPTPYSAVGPSVVHPSVVYVDGGGWNGYPYWMANTPYPNNDSAYENPCVLCSLDGDNWVVPPGVTNPLYPQPTGAGTAYARDTHLILNPLDTSEMILIYLDRNIQGDNRLYVVTSRNGFKTYYRTEIWRGTIGTGTGANQGDMASPSIWYDTSLAKWVVIGHNLDASGTKLLRRITSSTLLSGWDATPVAVTLAIPYAGRDWWHSHIAFDTASGLAYGLMQDNSGAGAPGNIYLVWSTDRGLTFTSKPIDMAGNWYRPTFCVRRASDGTQYLDCYFNTLLNTVTYRITMRFDAQLYTISPSLGDYQSAIAGFNPGGQILLADNCTRADSATVPGSPTIGGAYSVTSGIFGISTNRLYGVNTSGNNKLLSASLGLNYRFSARLAALGTQAWVIFRGVDNTNGFRVGFNTTSTYRLQKIVAGAIDATFTDRAVGPAPAAGDLIEVECSGATSRIRINGVFVAEFEDATWVVTGVSAGLQTSGAALTYFDSLLAKRL